MKYLGCTLILFSLLFFWGMWHAIQMYNIQGDPRWMMSVIACPIFGLLTAALGAVMIRV